MKKILVPLWEKEEIKLLSFVSTIPNKTVDCWDFNLQGLFSLPKQLLIILLSLVPHNWLNRKATTDTPMPNKTHTPQGFCWIILFCVFKNTHRFACLLCAHYTKQSTIQSKAIKHQEGVCKCCRVFINKRFWVFTGVFLFPEHSASGGRERKTQHMGVQSPAPVCKEHTVWTAHQKDTREEGERIQP